MPTEHHPPSIGVVIPLHNQLDYTRLCLESLFRTGPRDGRHVVVDNASSDGTGDYLRQQAGLVVVANTENRGCAAAWNQGVLKAASEWTMIINNDIVLTMGWWQALTEAAERWNLDIVSPAMREGPLNYDIEYYARDFTADMQHVIRPGVACGACFMVHRRVFEQIGMFDENFRIGQFEDTDFFRRASFAGFRLGIVGCGFLHHFGSVTQDAIRSTWVEKPYAAENRAYYNAKWRLTWWKRFILRRKTKAQHLIWRRLERLRHKHTLKERWVKGRLLYD